MSPRPLTFVALCSCAAAAAATTLPQPMPSGFSPASGPPGTVITVPGTGFTGLTGVWFAGVKDARFYVLSDTLLKVVVPADAVTAHLGFINPQRQHWTSANFTVTGAAPTPPPPPTPPPAPPPGAVGTVSGDVAGPAGAAVHLTGSVSRVAPVASGGAYSFTGVAHGIYTVAPSASGMMFTPTSLATTVDASPVKNVNFAGWTSAAAGYTLSGTISGAAMSGATVTLNGANLGSVATDLGGNYSFPPLPSGVYTVSASRAGHAFSPSHKVTLTEADSAGNDFSSKTSIGILAVSAVSPLPEATLGRAYSESVLKSVNGGSGGYHYQVGEFSTGAPPPGMVLNNNATLTGVPAKAGTYPFELCATDEMGRISTPCAKTTVVVASTAPTPPPTPTPPPPPSPPPVSGTSWVYYNGVLDWPGDYSFSAAINYADAGGGPLSGPHDVKVTLTGPWGGWLPYAKNWNFDSKGYTKLTFSLKPTVSNQQWNVYFVKVGDIPVGVSIDPARYGPAPQAGKWATYTVPLADLGVLGTSIYKFCIHDQTGLSSNTWYVDNVGFVP